MTSPKLVQSPPQGSGLVPSIVEGHFEDLLHGKPGEHVVVAAILQPVGISQRRTKEGVHRTTTYEVVRLEPMRDSHDADHVSWLITRAHDLRHEGSQMALPISNSPAEARANLLAAIEEWAKDENVSQEQLDERWLAYFGGPEHASTDKVDKGSLVQIQEFAGHVGAIVGPYADGSTDAAPAEGGEGDDESGAEGDDEAAAEVPEGERRLASVPFQSPAGEA
jgi:hypothetical protein